MNTGTNASPRMQASTPEAESALEFPLVVVPQAVFLQRGIVHLQMSLRPRRPEICQEKLAYHAT